MRTEFWVWVCTGSIQIGTPTLTSNTYCLPRHTLLVASRYSYSPKRAHYFVWSMKMPPALVPCCDITALVDWSFSVTRLLSPSVLPNTAGSNMNKSINIIRKRISLHFYINPTLTAAAATATSTTIICSYSQNLSPLLLHKPNSWIFLSYTIRKVNFRHHQQTLTSFQLILFSLQFQLIKMLEISQKKVDNIQSESTDIHYIQPLQQHIQIDTTHFSLNRCNKIFSVVQRFISFSDLKIND